MNSGHDLGGMHGLGPINPEPETEEPVFHADWERKAFSLTLVAALLGRWNIDMGRHSRERQHPARYLLNTYYENWFTGTELLLQESGLVTAEEIATGKPQAPAPDAIQVPGPDQALNAVKAGGPADMDVPVQAQYAVGDAVRVKNFHPQGHTRAPRYTRGHVGVVQRLHGVHVYPDTHAPGVTEGYPLYSVRFEGDELWGPDGDAKSAVYADLWEPYLEPA